ncbi:MAG: PEP-CTERM sorting domain-containing protein [Pirellulales bacterium]|nr:PEP-CTERM sorting domain-containing protein [Pirellulales bacterium]
MISALPLRISGVFVRGLRQRFSSKFTSAALGFFASAVLLAPAEASFIVYDGNIPQPGDQNVLINNNEVGTSIQGNLNNTGNPVLFTSPSQFIAGPSNGQARVEGRSADDIDASVVDIDDSIIINLLPPKVFFASVIFNAFDGSGSLTVKILGINADLSPAMATITLDNDGNPLTLGNGQNFYTVLADGGMLMTSVEVAVNSNTTYSDLRQFRIGGVAPEPGALVLSGLGAIVMIGFRRRTGARAAV